ncbi:MAG: hypothetical protein HEP71_03310 [Roseivirga sp.]|nr:hypothetical protein [Roseivirga sp.]
MYFSVSLICSSLSLAQSGIDPEADYKTGLTFKNRAQYDSALFYYTRALEGFRQQELPEKIAGALNRIGIVHFRLTDYDKAMLFQLQSFRINDSLQYKPGIMRNMLNMGNIFNTTLDQAEAKKHYLEAIKAGTNIEEEALLATTLNNLGSLYIDHPLDNPFINYDSALHYFKAAKDIYKELSDETGITEGRKKALEGAITGSLQNFGRVYEEKADYDSALYYYNTALGRSDIAYVKATLYENIGNVYKKSNNPRQSLTAYRKGFALAMESKVKNRIQTLSKNLADALVATNQPVAAVPFYQQHMAYKDSVYNDEKTKQASLFKTIYQTERKEKELVEQQAKTKEAQLTSSRLQTTLLISVLLAAIAITFFMQRSRINKIEAKNLVLAHNQEVDKLLQQQDLKTFDALMEGQEKERKRLAEELHDRLGSVLSAAKMHLEGGYDDGLKPQQFDYVNNLLTKAIDDTRQISHNMLSGVLTKFGLVAALHDLKETVSSSDHLKVSLKTLRFDERLEGDKEMHLYRIVQELLSNTLRHAEADQFDIKLEKQGTTLTLTVADNGKGTADTSKKSGIGIKNIESRVQKIGAEWAFSSPQNKGTEAIITLTI